MMGAGAAFGQVEYRCETLDFPHGAFSICYALAMETLTRIEAGQLDRAADLVQEVARRGAQHGFDEWVMIAGCNQASVSARAALAAGETDPEVWQAHIAANTAIVEGWRAAETKTFLACYDGVLARVLTAAGMKEQARERVDLALQMADETGIHFYDAELLRIRAFTYDDREMRKKGIRAAIELAQKQGAHTFELRAAADAFELFGEPARTTLEEALSRFPEDQTWPELARARALLL
jgi:tetratricopeptide (TPR) repeat protein